MKRPPRLRLRHHLLGIVMLKMLFLGAWGHWLHGQRPAPVNAAAVTDHLTGLAADASPGAPIPGRMKESE